MREIWTLFHFRAFTFYASPDDALYASLFARDRAASHIADVPIDERTLGNAFLRFVAWNPASCVRLFEDFPRIRSFFEFVATRGRFLRRANAIECSAGSYLEFEFINGCAVRVLPTVLIDDRPHAFDIDVLNFRTLNRENLRHACSLKRAPPAASPLVVVVGCVSRDLELERRSICTDEATRREWEFLFDDEAGDSRPTVVARLCIGEGMQFNV
jgi:hypothetical protein